MTYAPFDLIIYHANCLDGFTAAWVAKKHSPDAQLLPANYGDSPPDVEGLRVLVVDFSYERAEFLEMAKTARGLLVLDHHESNLRKLEGLDFAVFDMERSGAGLAWDVLHRALPRPRLVDIVEDRDLWNFRLSHTKAVNAAMTLAPFTLEAWDQMDDDFYALVRQGIPIRQYLERMTARLAKTAHLLTYGGYEFLAVNVPRELSSDTADQLKERAGELPIMLWYWDGEVCRISLRSGPEGPNVAKIAEEFGGGGHYHAAGFRADRVPGPDDAEP